MITSHLWIHCCVCLNCLLTISVENLSALAFFFLAIVYNISGLLSYNTVFFSGLVRSSEVHKIKIWDFRITYSVFNIKILQFNWLYKQERKVYHQGIASNFPQKSRREKLLPHRPEKKNHFIVKAFEINDE